MTSRLPGRNRARRRAMSRPSAPISPEKRSCHESSSGPCAFVDADRRAGCLDLAGNSAPRGARPFTAREVAQLRKEALATQSLIAIRAEVVGNMVGRCAVPKSMNFFYDGQEQAAR